jgi:hypothetical protein
LGPYASMAVTVLLLLLLLQAPQPAIVSSTQAA